MYYREESKAMIAVAPAMFDDGNRTLLVIRIGCRELSSPQEREFGCQDPVVFPHLRPRFQDGEADYGKDVHS